METDERIQQVLQKHPHILLAVLFGSLARNAAGIDSDLDLAVSADRPLDANEKMQLVMDLASAVGRPVDLVDFLTVGEPLLGQILTGGRRLLGDDARYAALLSRHLFNKLPRPKGRGINRRYYAASCGVCIPKGIKRTLCPTGREFFGRDDGHGLAFD